MMFFFTNYHGYLLCAEIWQLPCFHQYHQLPYLADWRLLENPLLESLSYVLCFLQVASDYDVIVNCSGVGARHLVNDREVEPLKGQLIKACSKNTYVAYLMLATAWRLT